MNDFSEDLDDEIYRSRYPYAPHGERRAYVAGCRCSDCRLANRDYCREYARRNYDAAKRHARYEKTGRDWYQRTKGQTA